ncbi:MAG TPA: winged helix-turn-helix domain-containing protein [Streptosporangiaceae bacterium]|nr:winged helix-turn-helix domain-containing protein [Streptosporangiaceae bacterium]
MPRDPRHSYHWVSARLQDRIEAGEWLPGEQLPNMRDLADEYGVSLGTARKAVRVLEANSLVDVYPGWGVFRSST